MTITLAAATVGEDYFGAPWRVKIDSAAAPENMEHVGYLHVKGHGDHGDWVHFAHYDTLPNLLALYGWLTQS